MQTQSRGKVVHPVGPHPQAIERSNHMGSITTN
jgi:hypothetical protein